MCTVTYTMYRILLLRGFVSTAVILVVCVIVSARGACRRNEEQNCCPGYFYDRALDECKECPPGFIGINCSMECRYPAYGKHCQRECNCSEEYCNLATGCEKRKIIPRDSNVSESPLWMSTDKTDKTLQTNQGLQTTPILIGVIVFLCLILTAVAARFLWKKMTGTRLIMNIGDSEMRTTAMVGEIGQVDDMVDHDYEDLDEGKIGKDNMKEKKAASENDYVESLAFAKKEQNANERESKHFYDALK